MYEYADSVTCRPSSGLLLKLKGPKEAVQLANAANSL